MPRTGGNAGHLPSAFGFPAGKLASEVVVQAEEELHRVLSGGRRALLGGGTRGPGIREGGIADHVLGEVVLLGGRNGALEVEIGAQLHFTVEVLDVGHELVLAHDIVGAENGAEALPAALTFFTRHAGHGVEVR